MAICLERAVPLVVHLCCFYFSGVLIVGIISRLVFRIECGIRLYRFLFIAFSSILKGQPGAVAPSEACSLGMQAAPSSIPTPDTFFRGDLFMKTVQRPFSLFN